MNEGKYKFDVDAPVQRIANDTILHSLREFVKQHEPNQLTTLAYDAWRAKVCTAATASKRFGGWQAALEKVGVTKGNYMCAKCGARPPDVTLEIDHIIPLTRGGTDATTNLQVLCNRCNQGKRARME